MDCLNICNLKSNTCYTKHRSLAQTNSGDTFLYLAAGQSQLILVLTLFSVKFHIELKQFVGSLQQLHKRYAKSHTHGFQLTL